MDKAQKLSNPKNFASFHEQWVIVQNEVIHDKIYISWMSEAFVQFNDAQKTNDFCMLFIRFNRGSVHALNNVKANKWQSEYNA
jgi:hypothetical protein